MSHAIERLEDGTYAMAWAGDVPWHGLGYKVPSDLTPTQMLKAAHLDWEVEKVPAFAIYEGKKIAVGREALVRKSDGRVLDVVTPDWNSVQNKDAFEFFDVFSRAGDCDMHTAGSLQDGKIVWGLAKMKESFELFRNRDKIDAYLLFTNYHKYGFATDIRFTPVRVVCANTLALSLASKGDKVVRVSHRREFVADEVKETLGVAKEKLAKYKEVAKFLGSKKYKEQTASEYFMEMFPNSTRKEEKKLDASRMAKMAMDIVETQPGAEYAPGTFWNMYNAVTFLTDHEMGRTDDARLTNAWYGGARKLKVRSLEKAVELANAA